MKALLALLLTLSAVACQKPPPPTATPAAPAASAPAAREVSGQVFIAMQNGSAVKLGGVPVLIYPASVAATNLAAVREAVRARNAELVANLIAAEAAQIKTKAARALTWGALTNAHTNLNAAFLLSGTGRKGKSDPLEEFDRLSAARARMTAELQKFADRHDAVALTDVKAQLLVSRTRQAVLDNSVALAAAKRNWPTPDFKATTDADGNFAARLPSSGESVAVVFASRRVGDNEEQYAWVQTVPTGQSRLLLSNENLLKD